MPTNNLTFETKLRRAMASLLTGVLTLAQMPLSADAATRAVPHHSTKLHSMMPAASKPGISAKQRAAMVHGTKFHALLSANPSDVQLEFSRKFGEPLIPMASKPVAGENAALASSLQKFSAKHDPEDLADLAAFIQSHPSSRWRPSLELNMGLLRFQTGYLTDALQLWTSSWNGSKSETGQMQQGVADNAMSYLLILEARLGRMSELTKNFQELGNRPFHGSSSTRVKNARDGLYAMEHSPGTSFKCGPFAVNSLLYLDKPNKAYDPRLKAVASTTAGTNLSQVKDWADMVGLNYQIAKRSAAAPLIVPAVAHWKAQHFGAITHQFKGRYRIDDPTFDEAGITWISQHAIDDQSDGYFLVPAGNLPSGWRSVSREEAATVWGKGLANGRAGGLPPTNPKTNPPPCKSCKCGMASASAFTMQAVLNIQDSPLSYSVPVGPQGTFSINYTQGETQPTLTFTNLTPWWSLNWVAWVNIGTNNQATVHVPGGGSEIYNYTQPDNVSNPYPSDLTSQAVLTIAGDGIYQRQLPDGSIQVFSLSDNSSTPNIFMTSVIDAQGNAATLNWDTTNFRLLSITDALGNVSYVNYVSNTIGNSGYYLVSSIVDPSGRTATFGYDSTNAYLLSSTDAAGNVSQFAYATTSSTPNFINTMTTPYGTTTFNSYTPSGPAPFPPQGLRFSFPDGTTSVLENWIGETKTTYYWNREAMALYPQDPANRIYSHSTNTKFLFDASTNLESPVVNYSRQALESPVTYVTQGESGGDFQGTSNLPITISRSLTGNPVENMVVGGTGSPTVGDTLTLAVADTGLTGFGGPESLAYTVKSGDTFTTVATAFAGLINGDGVLPNLGITGSSSGTTVHIQSLSQNNTSYSTSIARAATETFSVAGATVAVGGTATPTDVTNLTINSSALPSGAQTVTYPVASGDSLTSIAVGLAAAVNSNSALSAAGIGANTITNTIYITGLSTGTIAASAVGVPNETLTLAANGISATISGTLTVGNTVNVTVHDSALTGGQESVNYVIKPATRIPAWLPAWLQPSI